jgi:hypothetical protein
MDGIGAFETGLQTLGLEVKRQGNIVLALLDPHIGPLKGSEIWVGADPPADFPRVPPHWVFLPSEISLSGSPPQAAEELGAGWCKWSRPHPRWLGGDQGARAWVAHVRSLLVAIAA